MSRAHGRTVLLRVGQSCQFGAAGGNFIRVSDIQRLPPPEVPKLGLHLILVKLPLVLTSYLCSGRGERESDFERSWEKEQNKMCDGNVGTPEQQVKMGQ